MLILSFLFAGITTASAQMPSLNMDDLAGAGKLLNQFTKKGLSPDALSGDFADVKKDCLKGTKGLTDVAGLGGHINKLIGFIKPGMFKGGVDVAQLMDAANSAKSIADATGLMSKLSGSLKPEAFKKGFNADKFNDALSLLGQ